MAENSKRIIFQCGDFKKGLLSAVFQTMKIELVAVAGCGLIRARGKIFEVFNFV